MTPFGTRCQSSESERREQLPLLLLRSCNYNSGLCPRSPTEHIINELDAPIVVRSVSGVVTLESEGDALPNVLPGLQGPQPCLLASLERGALVLKPLPPN